MWLLVEGVRADKWDHVQGSLAGAYFFTVRADHVIRKIEPLEDEQDLQIQWLSRRP